MLTTEVKDGKGTDHRACVTSAGSVSVSVVPFPAKQLTNDVAQQLKLFSGAIINSAGSSDLTVNGSVTNQVFECAAQEKKVISIHETRLLFHDEQLNIETAEARRFGSAAAAPGLNIGLKLQAIQSGITTELFINPVQVIGEFYNYAAGGLNTAIINDKDAVANGVDILLVIIKFVVPVVLMPGTQDAIRVVVSDDLTAVNKFEVYCYGTQELL
jgi:hypothetical protein